MSLEFSCGDCEAQGRRETMEDTHVIFTSVKDAGDHSFHSLGLFGVYDGHGGVDAAKLLKIHLHKNIFGCDEWKKGDVKAAITHGIKVTDEFIVTESNEKGWMNGSTGVVGIVANTTLTTANVGDSEAILIRDVNGKIEPVILTETHKASDPKEKERIEKLGGHVFFGRVFGSLAVSRSFGDSRFKTPKTTQDFVSCEPAISTIELNPQTDRYLVFACDGLWDVMSHREVAQFVASKHAKDHKSEKEIANDLVQEAFHKKTEDNVTVVVVNLKWGNSKHEEKKEETTPKEKVNNNTPKHESSEEVVVATSESHSENVKTPKEVETESPTDTVKTPKQDR